MLYHVCFYIFFYLSCHPRTLHSFPTRRSENTSHSFRASRARGGGVRRHCALARSRHSHGASWKDRSQSATDVIPSVDNGWVLRAGFDHLLTTVGFFGLGLTIVPRIVKRL